MSKDSGHGSNDIEAIAEEQAHDQAWQVSRGTDDNLSDIAYSCTSPHVESMKLQAMGFSDNEAKAIINGAISNRLICKGCGHIVLELSRVLKVGTREAGLLLAEADEKAWTRAVSQYDSICEEIIPANQ